MTLLNYIGLGLLITLALSMLLGLWFGLAVELGHSLATTVIFGGLLLVGLLHLSLYLLFL